MWSPKNKYDTTTLKRLRTPESNECVDDNDDNHEVVIDKLNQWTDDDNHLDESSHQQSYISTSDTWTE
jgi:hypothetical protein